MTLNHKYSPQESISLIGKRTKCIFHDRCWAHQMWAAQLINCQPKNGFQVQVLEQWDLDYPLLLEQK
jgi:hypothetical protein